MQLPNKEVKTMEKTKRMLLVLMVLVIAVVALTVVAIHYLSSDADCDEFNPVLTQKMYENIIYFESCDALVSPIGFFAVEDGTKGCLYRNDENRILLMIDPYKLKEATGGQSVIYYKDAYAVMQAAADVRAVKNKTHRTLLYNNRSTIGTWVSYDELGWDDLNCTNPSRDDEVITVISFYS